MDKLKHLKPVIEKTKLIYILIFCLSAFISCERKRLYQNEVKIIDFLKKNPTNKPFQLVLDTISSFEWDEIIIAGPYTPFDRISNNSEYNLDYFNGLIDDNERYVLIGFINSKKGIKYIKLNRYLMHDSIYKSKGGNYKIYSRQNSNILISKHKLQLNENDNSNPF